MNSGIRFSRRPCQQREYGFILITSMLMLVMLTILGVSMGKSFGLQELIAGNQREKIRAFGAAESTLNYAEWWLNQPNNAGTGTNCTGVTTTPIVCSNALANPTVLDSITHRWLVGVNYTPLICQFPPLAVLAAITQSRCFIYSTWVVLQVPGIICTRLPRWLRRRCQFCRSRSEHLRILRQQAFRRVSRQINN